jgi:hypothetical protein
MDCATTNHLACKSAMQKKAVQHPAAARASFFLQIGLRSFAGGNPAAALTRLQVQSLTAASLCKQTIAGLRHILLLNCQWFGRRSQVQLHPCTPH